MLAGALLLGQHLQEVVGQQLDVFGTLPQRGHRNLEDLETVIEVLAQQSLGEHLIELAVGGRDDPDIHLDGRLASGAREVAALQHAQQLHLQIGRHLGDFVEEERAAVGAFEHAAMPPVGAGEAPAFVAEELALHQGGGDRAAVDRDEAVPAPTAQIVEGPRHQLLARPRLTRDQDRRARRRDPRNQLVDLLHGR